jgi:hypothetical protein
MGWSSRTFRSNPTGKPFRSDRDVISVRNSPEDQANTAAMESVIRQAREFVEASEKKRDSIEDPALRRSSVRK